MSRPIILGPSYHRHVLLFVENSFSQWLEVMEVKFGDNTLAALDKIIRNLNFKSLRSFPNGHRDGGLFGVFFDEKELNYLMYWESAKTPPEFQEYIRLRKTHRLAKTLAHIVISILETAYLCIQYVGEYNFIDEEHIYAAWDILRQIYYKN